jgi:CubicO group peptidase (beta-lactamase class C family)
MTAAEPEGMPRIAAVDRLFADWNEPHRPGWAVAVVNGDMIVHKQCYGLANVETGEPFRSDLRFPIASLTKQFTALCMLLLEEQGRVSLDQDLREVCPGCTRVDMPITIRQLCNNTSGLRDYITLGPYAGGRLIQGLGRDGIKSLIAGQATLNFAPGTRYCYSNTNYVLMSWIIEHLTGQSLADALATLIFGPLGMTATSLVANPLDGPEPAVKGYSGNPDVGFRPWHWDMHMAGEGGIWSSLDDLVKWELNFATPRVGSRDLFARLGERQLLNDGTPGPYALGLAIGTLCGQDWEGHSGGWEGYRSFRLRFPVLGLGVIVLANFTEAIQAVTCEVASVFLPFATPLPRMAGRYRSLELSTDYEVAVRDGQALLSVAGPEGSLEELPLVRRDDHVFISSRTARRRWTLEFDTEFRFEFDGAGSASHLILGCELASGIVCTRVS